MKTQVTRAWELYVNGKTQPEDPEVGALVGAVGVDVGAPADSTSGGGGGVDASVGCASADIEVATRDWRVPGI